MTRLAAILILLCACTHAAAQPKLWDQEVVPVYHNPSGAVVPTDYAQGEILWSIGQWNAALDHVTLEYAGETQAGSLNGAIVVSHIDLDGVNGITFPTTRLADRYQRIHKSRVWISTINRSRPGACWRSTLLHEFGHALGIAGHHADQGNVMWLSSMCNSTLTADDVAMVPTEPLPEPEPPPQPTPPEPEPEPPKCIAILRDNYDLFFPAVWDGADTVEALLEYDGGGWMVAYATPVDATCEPLETDGDAVIVYAGGYKAWLMQTGPQYFSLVRAVEI